MVDTQKLELAVKMILEAVGEDPDREGLLETPARVARLYEEVFRSMDERAETHLAKTFPAASADLVLEKDISFYSVCEHHLAPFFGKAHIAYLPGERVAGLSKLARTVEVFARRPQLQERMTNQIADAVEECLSARGVMVVVEAEHTCMTMRGVKKPGTKTVTISLRGVFRENAALKADVLALIRG